MPTSSKNLSEIVSDYLTIADSPLAQIFGWNDYNKALGGGLRSGSLNVVVAKSGFGKSSYLVFNAMELAINHQHKVLFASIELTSEKIAERFLSNMLSLNYNTMGRIKCETPQMIADAIEIFKNCYSIRACFPVYIEDLYEIASMEKHENGYDYLFIDHIHELDTKQQFKNENEKFRYIVNFLEKLYKEQGITIVAAAQFTKGNDKFADFGERDIDDIRGASELRNKCSNIIYLYETKDQFEGNVKLVKSGKTEDCTCQIKLLKARDGWGGWQTTLLYDKAKVKFKVNE